MTNTIVIVSTLIIGGLAMYWLQTWADNLKRRIQLETALPATLKVVEVTVETPKPVMGRDDERVLTAVSFEVQLPLQTPYLIRAPWIVTANQIMNLRAGISLPVKFNARASKTVFPNVSWATYDWHRESQILPMPETA